MAGAPFSSTAEPPMNRAWTNRLRIAMDRYLPLVVRDNRVLMYPLFYVWYKGRNVSKLMEFKAAAPHLSDEEFAKVYQDVDCPAQDRPTDLSPGGVKHILESLDPHSRTLLDVGCGRGFLVEQVQQAGYEVSGCDLFSENPLKNAPYRQASVEKLPYNDQEFDIVVCSHTLEHVRQLPEAIAELKRVARKQLIVALPCQKYFRYTFDLHLHFFTQGEEVKRLFQLPDAEIRNIEGDWIYIARLATQP